MMCPHCGAAGEIVGTCPDILPTSVQCGGCREAFPYVASALERVFCDVSTDKNKPFYFRPYCRGESLPTTVVLEPEDPRIIRIQAMSTRELIGALHRHRGRPPHTDDDTIYIGYDHSVYTAREIKAVLATRPHMPSKKEARQARQRGKQRNRGGRCDR